MPLKQVGSCKSFRAYLTLVRLFLRVHSDMAGQVIESCIAFGAFATTVQSLTGWNTIYRWAFCIDVCIRS